MIGTLSESAPQDALESSSLQTPPWNPRPNQVEPSGDWRYWLVMAGRGFGKTRLGAETIRRWVMEEGARSIALVGATADEVRQVMVEGVSGLLAIHPPHERPRYEPSKKRLTWPNGAVAYLYSARAYEKLRGPEFDAAWIDELAKFEYGELLFQNLNLALRLGRRPKMVITTTPRARPLMKRLLGYAKKGSLVLTTGTTYDNTEHLSAAALEEYQSTFAGTRFEAQEILGQLVEDDEGTLWKQDVIDTFRVKEVEVPLKRVVVAVDPAATHNPESDETGLVVAALGTDNQAYILEDLSGRYPAREWTKRAVAAYERHKADGIIYEQNIGGDAVGDLIQTFLAGANVIPVMARRSKITRAEPIAALYEKGRVHHVGSDLKHLEKQMTTYIPGVSESSPDRMDALVWALSELMLGQHKAQPPPNLWRRLGKGIMPFGP